MNRPTIAAVLLAAFATLTGCLERTESITINPDGSALLRSEFKGDADDLNTGDAIPGAGGPWLVTDDPQKDDSKKTLRNAELSVPAGQPFPSTYLHTSNDPRADRVLSFPTSVRVMQAPADANGIARTYFDFKRTYQRRDDARYTLTQRTLEKNDALKALKDKDLKQLTDDDRQQIVLALAKIECAKLMEFADAGVKAVGESWPQEIGLLVRQSINDYLAGFDPKPFSDLLAQPESDDRAAKIAESTKQFTEGVRAAVLKHMDALGLSKESQSIFMAAAEAEADRRAVTEDLADEKWEVRVTMPGTITAHNGDRVEGNTIIWQFGAEHLMDRDQTLMASSRVDEK